MNFKDNNGNVYEISFRSNSVLDKSIKELDSFKYNMDNMIVTCNGIEIHDTRKEDLVKAYIGLRKKEYQDLRRSILYGSKIISECLGDPVGLLK